MALFFDKDTEVSILTLMKDYPLEAGQALWLGPQSVRILAAPEGFKGRLPDKIVFEPGELFEPSRRAKS